MNQEKALEIILAGHNVFLTGPPGSGKSYLLKIAVKEFQNINKKVAITASTGIAASQINGLTLHSWSNISDFTKNKTLYDYESNKDLVSRYKQVDVLIIDEISMLDAEHLASVNNMAKFLRKSSKPFGGIQLILVGDFFQLPPVSKALNPRNIYLFESDLWKELDLTICYLNTQYRQQTQGDLMTILTKIRNNSLDKYSLNILQNRVLKPKNSSMLKLYSHNYDVNIENHINNQNLKTKTKRFKLLRFGIKKYIDDIIYNNGFKDPQEFKIGSKVIFILNRPNLGYVNGLRGEIISFKKSLPLVKTDDRRIILVDYQEFCLETNNVKLAKIICLPLKLAWAITIHKSQGMSLNCAEIDLNRSFSPGMGYVALSRVKSLEGVYLKGFNKMAFLVDKRVSEIDKTWVKASSLGP